MGEATSLEIRILLCSLNGDQPFRFSFSQNDESDPLQNAIECAVSNIEKGEFGAVLVSSIVKSVLWQPLSCTWSSLDDSPDQLFSMIRARVLSFLDWTNDADKALAKRRAFLVMAVGIAALLSFWQINVTGPCVDFPSCQKFLINHDNLCVSEAECNKWAVKQLMLDGCDLAGLCSLPQYLILAKILLVDILDAAQGKSSLKEILPVTISWWSRRALIANQSILAERSPSLCTSLMALKPEGFGLSWGTDLNAELVQIIEGALQLEYGFIEYAFGHVDQANFRFNAAREVCGLEISLTGMLGFRTAHQIDPKAQMVLIARTSSDANELLEKDIEKSSTVSMSKDGKLDADTEEDILMLPRLVSAEDRKPKMIGNQLNSFQQAVVLAQCLHVKKSNPDDEMRGWQMAPFIEAVDSQESSHFLIKRCSQLLRIRWECTRSRTKQRALLMLDKLVEDIRGTAVYGVQERMCFAFCLQFPPLSSLRKELAEMMVSCGLVGEALQTFEELELWNSLIDCYCLLGKKAVVLDLIKERLKEQPDDPRLWCAMGDVTFNEDCYEKAWEVSKHRFGRAQRSLGRSAYNKAEYSKSMQHWQAALTLNPLHSDGWFALGSAALKARDLDKAVDAFTRAVQLDPENGEAWNNIAAIHMTRKKSKEAFVAFKEALKFKRTSWQMWENYAQVSLDVHNIAQAIEAVNMVLDLSQGKRIMVDTLDKLMDEVEALNKANSNEQSINPSVRLENGSTDLEKGAMVNESSNQPSLPTTKDAATIVNQATENEWLLARVGKLLSRVVQISPTSAAWGLLARWHKVKGDSMMRGEALLKQVRSLQGSDWQHNKEHFKELSQVALQLSDVYMETSSKTGYKKDLYSVQMLLRNLIKQGEQFSDEEYHAAVVKCLSDVEQTIRYLK